MVIKSGVLFRHFLSVLWSARIYCLWICKHAGSSNMRVVKVWFSSTTQIQLECIVFLCQRYFWAPLADIRLVTLSLSYHLLNPLPFRTTSKTASLKLSKFLKRGMSYFVSSKARNSALRNTQASSLPLVDICPLFKGILFWIVPICKNGNAKRKWRFIVYTYFSFLLKRTSF